METGFSSKFLLYTWILFSKISINWFIIKPQFEIGIVHFFLIPMNERCMVFLTASSKEMKALILCTF